MTIGRTTTAVLAGLLTTALAVSAAAQPAGPPPAVLVQPVEAKALGRATGIHRPRRRRRQGRAAGPREGLSRPAQIHRRRRGQGRPDPVHHRARPYQAAVDQKTAARDSAKAALANAEGQLKRAAELLRTNTGTQVDLRPAPERAAPGQGRRRAGRGRPARRADPALLHRDQLADHRPHRHAPRSRPATSSAPIRACWQPSSSEQSDARAVPGDPARVDGGAARRQRRRHGAAWSSCGWPTAASTRRRARSTSSTSRSIPRPTARSCAPYSTMPTAR